MQRCAVPTDLNSILNWALKEVGTDWGMYLGGSSEVNDTIQQDMLPKLAVKPAMPVLVDSPFCLIQALALIEVGCKDVPKTWGQSREGICITIVNFIYIAPFLTKCFTTKENVFT